MYTRGWIEPCHQDKIKIIAVNGLSLYFDLRGAKKNTRFDSFHEKFVNYMATKHWASEACVPSEMKTETKRAKHAHTSVFGHCIHCKQQQVIWVTPLFWKCCLLFYAHLCGLVVCLFFPSTLMISVAWTKSVISFFFFVFILPGKHEDTRFFFVYCAPVPVSQFAKYQNIKKREFNFTEPSISTSICV